MSSKLQESHSFLLARSANAYASDIVQTSFAAVGLYSLFLEFVPGFFPMHDNFGAIIYLLLLFMGD